MAAAAGACGELRLELDWRKGVAPRPGVCQEGSRREGRPLAEFPAQEQAGQLLLPLVELVTTTASAIDEVIELAGRASIEAVLRLKLRAARNLTDYVEAKRQLEKVHDWLATINLARLVRRDWT